MSQYTLSKNTLYVHKGETSRMFTEALLILVNKWKNLNAHQ